MTGEFYMDAGGAIASRWWQSDDGRHLVINGDAHRLYESEVWEALSGKVDHFVVDWPAAPDLWTAEQTYEFIRESYIVCSDLGRPNASLIAIPRDRRSTYYSKGALAGAAAVMKGSGDWQLWREFIWWKRQAEFDRTAPAFSNVYAFRRGGMTATSNTEARYKDIVQILAPGSTSKVEGHSIEAIPQDVFRYFLPLFGRPDDRLLDPYAGSGASAIVGIELGMKTVSVELDPAAYDRIINRIQRKLAGDGIVELP